MSIHIWAPHPDDEVIGCHSILLRNPNITVHFLNGSDPGIERASEMFLFTARSFCESEWVVPDEGTIFCPDPQYDNHPAHQYMGHLAANLFRNGIIQRLIFYTTMMNTPYIWEVGNPKAKMEALNACYPEKSDLWKYDHRYFLFEGFCEWHRLG